MPELSGVYPTNDRKLSSIVLRGDSRGVASLPASDSEANPSSRSELALARNGTRSRIGFGLRTVTFFLDLWAGLATRGAFVSCQTSHRSPHVRARIMPSFRRNW